jgi:phosphopantetheinyl transferase (holo-ACP synthase)
MVRMPQSVLSVHDMYRFIMEYRQANHNEYINPMPEHQVPEHQVDTVDVNIGHSGLLRVWFTQTMAARQTLLQYAATWANLNDLTLPQPHLSLSHSKTWLVLAAGASGTGITGMGVDVEAVRPLRLPNALRFYANAVEHAWWAAQPDSSVAAIQLWTQKEAAYKAYIRYDRRLTSLQVKDWQWRPNTLALPDTLASQSLTCHWTVTHPEDARPGHGITWAMADQWISVCWLGSLK